MLDGGYFYADSHRENLLMTEGKELAFVDFGMMARVLWRIGEEGWKTKTQLRDILTKPIHGIPPATRFARRL